MATDVIAVFDIGKTNKKVLLFDRTLSLVYQEEQKFDEILDDDGFACDDIEKVEKWMTDSVGRIASRYNLKAINFTTYGATLMYLDSKGKRLTPAYNYLKPMPDDVLENFYDRHGGVDEFSRQTASPALGMLNSGLQVLWLKRKKPEIFKDVDVVLHFPQYVSYCFTGQKISEYTSIGCHTALWDFDKMQYHRWLADEHIQLPEAVSNSQVYDVEVNGKTVKVGTGIHDSSASLVPYLRGSTDQFILISTGTWCIMMNPFNDEPLTADQLKKDTLCYMSVNQKQVKSSRLFLGYIHDVNVHRLAEHFKLDADHYKKVTLNEYLLPAQLNMKYGDRIFFRSSVPEDYVDHTVDLGRFSSFDHAYHRLMHDLVSLCMESLNLVIPVNDQTKAVYITGGFARNEIFIRLLAAYLPDKIIFTSEMDNATALGTAIVVCGEAFKADEPDINLGLQEYTLE